MILSDKEIIEYCEQGMITPFERENVKLLKGDNCISFGVGSYGYDIRLDDEYTVPTDEAIEKQVVIDPLMIDENIFQHYIAPYWIIKPNSFILARSMETFKIPRELAVMCVGKSTYARCGIITNITPLEPNWRGVLTIEISNTTPLPVKVYSWMGIAQIVFFRPSEICQVSYADKKGRYQGQSGITLPR